MAHSKIASALQDELEKISGVAPNGEELDRFTHTVLTRRETRAQTHDLFANAAAAQKRDQDVVGKLFVQAPLAHTGTDQLLKTASVYDRFPELLDSPEE